MDPTFSIRDNGDGTATVFDGGLAVMTVRRDRGNWNVGRTTESGYTMPDTVTLGYVAQGFDTVEAGQKYTLDGAQFQTSVAGSSKDTATRLPLDEVNRLIANARPVYVAGRVADLRRWHAQGKFDKAAQAELVEWIPKYRENGEPDLADAFAAFLAEIQS